MLGWSLVAQHEGKKFNCDVCKKQFSTTCGLRKHRQSTHGEKEVIQCPTCGKGFNCKANLKLHKKSLHLREKYPCNLCDYEATQKGSLTTHIRHVHFKGQLPTLRCNECNFKSSSKASYKKHTKLFHSEMAEVYTCKVCNFKTIHKSTLPMHERKHKADMPTIKCNDCDHETIYKGKLAEHRKLFHSGEIKYYN